MDAYVGILTDICCQRTRMRNAKWSLWCDDQMDRQTVSQ